MAGGAIKMLFGGIYASMYSTWVLTILDIPPECANLEYAYSHFSEV